MRGLCYSMDMENNTMPAKTGPKVFFVHLLTFGLLYVFSISFIGLWWQYINIKFPDLLQNFADNGYGYDQLRLPMAVLIIVFPVLVALARMTTREIAADPSKKDARIYRWLVYLTLFMSAVTVIVDLVTLLYNFLGGDLTIQFVLKVCVVLAVALGIFGYFLWHLRSDVSQTSKKRHTILWASVAVVILSIVMAFFIVGSPAQQRALRFDQQRINDLQNLQYQILNYWQQKRELPATQAELVNYFTGFVPPKDPRTLLPYEYIIIEKGSFKVCATFEKKGTVQSYDSMPYVDSMAFPGKVTVWDHGIGRTCFDRTIDPELYPKPVKL